MGWDTVYDKAEEKWIVSEFSRDLGSFEWRCEAEQACLLKNQPLVQRNESETWGEANDIWPGHIVSWGASTG
jgi:hypothetical protein